MPVLVVHDPAPEVSATPRMLGRLLGHRPPIIRAGSMRKPLDGDALRGEVAKFPDQRVVIARSAELVGRDPASGLVSCATISHPVLVVLRSFEHLATSRIKREGAEATPDAVAARLRQMLADANPRYPIASPQAGLYATTGETQPRPRPVRARETAAIATAIEARALLLFTDFPAALTHGLRLAAEAARLDWSAELLAHAGKASATRNMRSTLRDWRTRLGAELFQKLCEMSRGDLALLGHLFTDWSGKSGLAAEDVAGIEQTLAASARVTARRRNPETAPTQQAA